MLNLRPYQEDLIGRARAAFKSGKRSPLLVSPCGSGKTVMFSYFASRISERGKRVVILAHRDELLDQISDTLNQFSVPHSFIASGRIYRNHDRVHVASVFSIVRRMERITPPDVIVIDEAHHAIAKSTWGRVFAQYPQALRIGVTATPSRMSGEPLNDIFDDLLLGPTVRELIDLGSLCDYKIYAPSTIATAGLHIRMGDYEKKELEKASDKPTITGDAIKEYEKLASGKRAIVFCCSIQHAVHVAAQFEAAGHASCSIDGKMDKLVRRGVIGKFRSGEIKVLTSCDIISEGFDLPAIEVAIMLRPTASLGLWIQQSGRALRPFPGKEHAIILDHAGNTMRHGLPDEDREWTLEGKKKKIGEKTTVFVRTCKHCFRVVKIGTEVCPSCGYVFEVQPREVDQKEGELVEVDHQAIRRQRNREQGMCKTYEELVELGKKRGYKRASQWAHFVMQSRKRSVAA